MEKNKGYMRYLVSWVINQKKKVLVWVGTDPRNISFHLCFGLIFLGISLQANHTDSTLQTRKLRLKKVKCLTQDWMRKSRSVPSTKSLRPQSWCRFLLPPHTPQSLSLSENSPSYSLPQKRQQLVSHLPTAHPHPHPTLQAIHDLFKPQT